MYKPKVFRRKKVLFRYLLIGLVPALMLLMWARHIYMVQTQHLDAWLGGGMRMFAFTDNYLFRKVLLTYKIEDTTIIVNAKSIGALFHAERKVRVMPGRQNLLKLQETAGNLGFIKNEINGQWLYDSVGLKTSVKGQLLKIQVFAYSFNEVSGKVNQVPLTALYPAIP